jgi:hypothetical protein
MCYLISLVAVLKCKYHLISCIEGVCVRFVSKMRIHSELGKALVCWWIGQQGNTWKWAASCRLWPYIHWLARDEGGLVAAR